jgi:DNA polymerase III sliding clamp (beta) subunit (PCNA family)
MISKVIALFICLESAMQVDRKTLIDALELCKPAISTTNRAPELTHFWLGKDRINTFNGHLAITSFIATDIEAGVPDTFLDWLEKTSYDTVNLTLKDTTLMAASGRAKASFATLDPKRQLVTQLPETTNRLPIDYEFVQALANVITSNDPKSTEPAKLGVFVMSDGIQIKLYATDDKTISAQTLQQDWPPQSFIVPIQFVKQIFKFLPAGGNLYLSPNTISLTTRYVVVTASLIETKMPDFAAIIATFDKPDILIPTGFTEALERVTLLNDEIQVQIADNSLYVLSRDQNNRAEEELPLASFGHSDILATFNAKLLKRALPGRTHLSISPNGMRLTGPAGFVHLIGTLE